MVFINVDLPQPFGPRTATCSPTPICKDTRSKTTALPRITETFLNSISAGSSIYAPQSGKIYYVVRDVRGASRVFSVNLSKWHEVCSHLNEGWRCKAMRTSERANELGLYASEC